MVGIVQIWSPKYTVSHTDSTCHCTSNHNLRSADNPQTLIEHPHLRTLLGTCLTFPITFELFKTGHPVDMWGGDTRVHDCVSLSRWLSYQPTTVSRRTLVTPLNLQKVHMLLRVLLVRSLKHT